MSIGRGIGIVALALCAGFGRAEDRVVEGTGAFVQVPLDLSEVWGVIPGNDMLPILWSSLGWGDVAEPESGKSVTLEIVRQTTGGEATILASGLKGFRQTYGWSLRGVTDQSFGFRHVVIGGSPLETPMNASFSIEKGLILLREALRPDDGSGWDYTFAIDEINGWEPIDGPGEGIKASAGTSSFAFVVGGRGTFLFDYALGGGSWTITVDGAPVQETPGAASDWSPFQFAIDASGRSSHTIVFTATLSGDDDFAWIRNVRWRDADWRTGAGAGSGAAVDLREGVLVAYRADELMPFAWSSTNFTGNALVEGRGFVAIDPQSVASVRVVQVTGAGDDVSQWTTEVSDTEKTLVAEKQGEKTVKWKGVQPGVWKADLVITTGGDEAYRETRILDLRDYTPPGLLFFLK